jgi:hypothetical protein
MDKEEHDLYPLASSSFQSVIENETFVIGSCWHSDCRTAEIFKTRPPPTPHLYIQYF